MKYSIKVNEVRAKEGSNIKGFATVVFGDSFKITNIAILENKDNTGICGGCGRGDRQRKEYGYQRGNTGDIYTD